VSANDPQAMVREGGGQESIRQRLRGAQHSPQPGMVRCHCSTGGSTEAKGSATVRLLLCGPKVFRVTEMSEVTRRFTGQHLSHRKHRFGRDTSTASPDRFAGEVADAASQTTCREKELIKVKKQGGGVAQAAPPVRLC
jgi:hypothetical protein